MREIKFAYYWAKNETEIIREIITLDELEKCLREPENGLNIWPPIARVQYTGLKDKNGIEIYEGDIVKHWRQGNRVVVYPLSENYAGYGVVSRDGMRNTLNDGDKLYEVIGNIHQNPELLDNA